MPLPALAIPALLKIGEGLIDRFFPDPEKASAAKLELLKLQESGELARMANDTKIQEAFLADVASARDRDKAFMAAGKKNFRGDVLAYTAMGALVGCLLLLFVFKVPQESREILLVVLGALVAIVKDVYGFEFGSSKDSQRNAQAVTDMLKHGG